MEFTLKQKNVDVKAYLTNTILRNLIKKGNTVYKTTKENGSISSIANRLAEEELNIKAI